ncbi:uncharacterized protein LOC117170300 [Belonocnema kinseyi]|uniref:uncharacterized protein LOC117170300 n=1 Tax=Belonocnema kinseyi TaxID=2817044 RepID=UPI00143D58CF|nr:uncharacterized protein LOC117170300 [Belonocnema kinseyi]
MKIRISTLFLTIAIFLHFFELNASGKEGTISSRLKRKRNFEPVDCPETRGQAHETIIYHDRTGHDTNIKLWLDSTRKYVLKAHFLGNRVPTSVYYRDNNFYIRVIYLRRWEAVGYFKLTGRLFAVRAPNPDCDHKSLEPTESTWFIIFSKYKFLVTEDLQKGKVQGIHLWPINLHQDPENSNRVKPQKITLAGVSFIVYRTRDMKILGAQLDPAVHTP